jgi:hypothetical protein
MYPRFLSSLAPCDVASTIYKSLFDGALYCAVPEAEARGGCEDMDRCVLAQRSTCFHWVIMFQPLVRHWVVY